LPSLFFSFFSLVLRLNILLKIPTAYNTGLAKWLSDTQANAQKPLRQARKRYTQFVLIFFPLLSNDLMK